MEPEHFPHSWELEDFEPEDLVTDDELAAWEAGENIGESA